MCPFLQCHINPGIFGVRETFSFGAGTCQSSFGHGCIQACGSKSGTQSEYEQFVADRLKMLELRNQRLNVRLMEVSGVNIVQELTPEWEVVQSQRDNVQAEEEAKSMETILRKWSK